MKRIAILIAFLAATLSAQPKPAATQGLPPLIGR